MRRKILPRVDVSFNNDCKRVANITLIGAARLVKMKTAAKVTTNFVREPTSFSHFIPLDRAVIALIYSTRTFL